jgi:hypothetical protein
MKKMLVLVALALLVVGATSGCKSSGSREFTPGRGWTPTD